MQTLPFRGALPFKQVVVPISAEDGVTPPVTFSLESPKLHSLIVLVSPSLEGVGSSKGKEGKMTTVTYPRLPRGTYYYSFGQRIGSSGPFGDVFRVMDTFQRVTPQKYPFAFHIPHF